MIRTVVIINILLLFSCNCNDVSTSQNAKDYKDVDITFKENLVGGVDIKSILENKAELLPDMCSIISIGEIAEIFGVEERAISTNANIPKGIDPERKSCFFKWDDINYPNSGIMLQAMRNPLPEEYPDYLYMFIDSKIQNGERSIAGEDPLLFKRLDGMASAGVYNTTAGKYFWRFYDQTMFMLAFNTSLEGQDQLEVAQKIGRTIIKNYLEIK